MAGGKSGFGALLRQYRLAAGLTQEMLAERAALSLRTIVYLEQDGGRTPRGEKRLLLATALGLSPQERAYFLAPDQSPASRPPGVAPASPPLHPLVGRQAVLAQLEAHLQTSGPPLFLLAGEPGIGKTRLLREVARHAVARGWTVLAGGCHRHGGQEPYAPLLDALQHHLAGQDPLTLQRTLEGCAWLVHLLPELAGGPIPPLPAQALSADQQRRLMFAAVQRCLTNLAGPSGSLLLLDDLQWAGRDALDLLATLLRSAETIPLRIIGAYRETELPAEHPLATLLADTARAGRVQQEQLGPLAESDAARLLDALLGEAEVDAEVQELVLRRASGMPFYLVSCVQALLAGQGEQDLETLPWDLRQSVRQRVAAVSEDGRAVLSVAAVAGRVVALPLLETASELSPIGLVEAVEAVCEARLLEEVGEEYRFVHDVIREVVEGDLGAARRALLHRRVAEALESRPDGAPVELLAYHYARSTASDKAVVYLECAGDQARARYAHDQAESHYRDLLERLQALGGERDRPRVWEKLGGVLQLGGKYTEALTLLDQASEAYRFAGDPEGEVRATAGIAWAHARQGTAEAGIARIVALLERLDERDPFPALAALHGVLAQLLFNTGRYEEASSVNRQAAELARAADDDRSRVAAEASRVHILIKLGRMDEAIQMAQAVLHPAQELGDLYLIAAMHRDLAFNLGAQGEFESARLHVERACVAARQAGDPGELVMATAIRGRLAFLRGDWSEARADLEEAVTLSGQGELSWHETYPLVFLAHLCLAEGDTPAASAAGNRALALAAQNGDVQGLRWTSGVMAELDIQESRADAALGRLLPLLDRQGLEEGDVTDLLPVLAWTYLETGQIDRAREVAGKALSRARTENARPILVEAYRVQALIALREEECHIAARSVKEGLALARAMPYPYATARLLQLDGGRLAAQGDTAGARQRLEEALAVFQRLGAHQDAECVERDMACLIPD